MGEFKDYVEGVYWNALSDAVKSGIKAYSDRFKKENEKSEKKKIEDSVLSAEGDELKAIIEKMVNKDYKIKNGKVEKSESKVKTFTDWLRECTNTKTESTSEKLEPLMPRI